MTQRQQLAEVLELLRRADVLLWVADPNGELDESQTGVKAALEGVEADLNRLV